MQLPSISAMPNKDPSPLLPNLSTRTSNQIPHVRPGAALSCHHPDSHMPPTISLLTSTSLPPVNYHLSHLMVRTPRRQHCQTLISPSLPRTCRHSAITPTLMTQHASGTTMFPPVCHPSPMTLTPTIITALAPQHPTALPTPPPPLLLP
jgi:hypothetical protein